MADKTIAQLDTCVTNTISDATVVELQIIGGAAPESRKATIAQLREVLNARTGQVSLHQVGAKAGATAGFVVNAADDLGMLATLPAAQTGSTLVVPISGLKVGQTITAFAVNGSLQSGGNANSLTADLRKLTAAAAGAVDSSVGAMAAPLSVTADTVVSSANAGKTGLAEVVAEDESYYLLITSTTGAACTQGIQNVAITVTEV